MSTFFAQNVSYPKIWTYYVILESFWNKKVSKKKIMQPLMRKYVVTAAFWKKFPRFFNLWCIIYIPHIFSYLWYLCTYCTNFVIKVFKGTFWLRVHGKKYLSRNWSYIVFLSFRSTKEIFLIFLNGWFFQIHLQSVTKIYIYLFLKYVFFADISGTTWAIKKFFTSICILF